MSKPEKQMIELPENLSEMSDEELDALADEIYRQLTTSGEG